MRPRCSGLIALVALLAGCIHHLEHDAPGRVDLEAPPRDPEARDPEVPKDPGERVLVLSGGGFLAGGTALGGPVRGAWSLGAEASVSYGESAWSHPFDDPLLVYPPGTLGLNLGWCPVGHRGSAATAGYVEAQYGARWVGFAAGYARGPAAGEHGPQVTAFAGPLFLRANHYLGRGTDFQVGLSLKAPALLVWSR